VHCCETGGRFWQAMDSFIPEATGPQAVDTAARSASACVFPETLAQFRPPLNSTHAWQSTRWADIVDQRRNPAKIAAMMIPIRVPRFMMATWMLDG